MRARLQKILASAGVASRRQSEAMIAAGEVAVNGRTASLGDTADPDVDAILVRGRPLPMESRLYLVMNKPPGVVTSLRSTHGEQTVADFLAAFPRVFPVGRLDRDTTGLLLLTNDGEWANLVTHPRYGLRKEYRATVRGHPSRATLNSLRCGVKLPEGVVSAPAAVQVVSSGPGESVLSISVVEGKKRQIRLMLAAVGYPVLTLERVRIDGIRLGHLAPGAVRRLTEREVESIRDVGRAALAGGGAKSGATHRG
jgi:23S rRNA pseudouridine2605 synthase